MKMDSDKKWEMFNKKIVELTKLSDFFGLGTTYYEMASFLKNEGQDDDQLRKLGYQMKLRLQRQSLEEYEKSNVVHQIEILTTKTSCKLCRALNGKMFPVKEALSSNPLPVENCTYLYGCRCVYLPIV